MAEALALVGHPIIHVVEAFPGNVPIPGRCDAEDSQIAEYCARTEHVLITTDKDFQARWVRSQLLAAHGVEVIVFTEEIQGLEEQHRRVTLHVPQWIIALHRDPYGYRVWSQRRSGPPQLLQGKHARRRAARRTTTRRPG